MNPCSSVNRRIVLLTLLSASALGVAAPAQARVFFGVGIGVPFGVWAPGPYYYPPPVYYPPPAYYVPPPVVYAPPQTYTPPGFVPQNYSQASPQGGQTCFAQTYRCPMDRPTNYGASCYCLGNGGQRVWGQAN